MNPVDFQNSFAEFAGSEQYQKFVRVLRQRGKLVYWQEALLSQFKVATGIKDVGLDLLKSLLQTCEVHGNELEAEGSQQTQMQMLSAIVSRDELEQRFPNAARCPLCRALAQPYLDQHARELAETARIHEEWLKSNPADSAKRAARTPIDPKQVIKSVTTTPPHCISGFRLTRAELPKPWDKNPRSVWKLCCACGGEQGRILGYSLRDYNQDYAGPESFISPLAFECLSCWKITEILDTDIHGYHAEIARMVGEEGSTKYRGEGPRKPFPCPKCGANAFVTTVGFIFWNPEELAEEYEERFEDLFNVFLCYCRCVACGELCEPTEFGKL